MLRSQGSLFFEGIFLKKGILEEFQVESARLYKDFCIIKLRDINTIIQAREFIGVEGFIQEKRLYPLEERCFYLYQIVSRSVLTENGEKIGTVKDVLSIKDNDILVVRKGP